MIHRVGPCVWLSVAVVAAAAVVLQKVEPPAATRGRAETRRSPRGDARDPPPTPAQPWPEPVAVADAPKPTKPTGRRAELTRAAAGETLADLAARVYGEGVDIDRLWRLNRDQVADRGELLREGLILRTPEL